MPPGRSASLIMPMKDFSNSAAAGPMGSDESDTITSNASLWLRRYTAASSTTRVSRGSSKASRKNGKNERDARTTNASMSHSTTDSTDLCLRTSRRTPPSPPPTIITVFGLGCAHIGMWAIGSWYENSSRSVSWIAPSSTSVVPYVADSKTSTSWN
eukprot:Amastigsp_a1969_47.p5 type:complete len:156 gc:universal Amastigsp_a1969_47:1548-2015(+)